MQGINLVCKSGKHSSYERANTVSLSYSKKFHKIVWEAVAVEYFSKFGELLSGKRDSVMVEFSTSLSVENFWVVPSLSYDV